MQFTHTAARKAKQKHTEFGENCSFAFSDYVKHYFLKLVMSKLGVCRQVCGLFGQLALNVAVPLAFAAALHGVHVMLAGGSHP